MHFDHSKIFVTEFALEFTEFQVSTFSLTFGLWLHRPSATEGEAEIEKPSTTE